MIKWLVLIAILFVILIFAKWMKEIHTFQVTKYEIHSPKLKGVSTRKIVFLSDLHNCSYGKDNEKLLKAVQQEKPDIILITGDMLVGKAGASTEIARNFVGKLPGICKTYYANGNHEQRMKEDEKKYGTVYKEYKAYLEMCGVCFLENECTEILWDGHPVKLWGLEIPIKGYGKFNKVSLPETFMEEIFGIAEKSAYHILLAHNPLFVKDYLKWGADLILSGHFHGGVVRIPFWRGVISSQGSFFPKYSGELTKEGNASIVVSKGIGLHTIRVRFNNPAEIVVLHFGGSEE